jgi:phosphoribosylformylglycinamidine cyclo-ligase
MSKIDYKSAGVNIDAGNEVIKRIGSSVRATHSSAVLTDIGGFGSLYDLTEILKEYKHPVLVQSIDGVGTKAIVARLAGDFNSIGYDLVSACCNDIAVLGAKPLTFLDYVANDRLRPDVAEVIISSIARACKDVGVALVGGETAEMPDTYLPDEHDLVGIVTGIVDKPEIINGESIAPGDAVLGFPSNGLHTNGYSLARKVLFDMGRYGVTDSHPDLDGTIGDALLKPHINYTMPIHQLTNTHIDIKGMAHITGGGLVENIPRILPENCSVTLDPGAWSVPPIINLIQNIGDLDRNEMFRTFNMGIGLVLIVNEGSIQEIVKNVGSSMKISKIGKVIAGNQKVTGL